MILAAEFPAIPSSAVKIASERRCAILVHSVPFWFYHRKLDRKGPYPAIPHIRITSKIVFELRNATGRIRFWRARFQTPSSVSFLGLTEFRGESSVNSSQPSICVPERTHQVFCFAELTEFAPKLSEAQ